MAKIYFRLVQKGLKTLEEVPEKYRAEVQRLLQEVLAEEQEGTR